jgi:acyl CoA:acetate/3-ketoacid CoA transferase alpha subunit
MKTLTFDGENYEAEKIIKSDTSIVGQDAKGNIVC